MSLFPPCLFDFTERFFHLTPRGTAPNAMSIGSGPQYITAKLSQPWNAPFPISLIELGSLIAFRFLQDAKHLDGIVVTPSGISIVSRLIQF